MSRTTDVIGCAIVNSIKTAEELNDFVHSVVFDATTVVHYRETISVLVAHPLLTFKTMLMLAPHVECKDLSKLLTNAENKQYDVSELVALADVSFKDSVMRTPETLLNPSTLAKLSVKTLKAPLHVLTKVDVLYVETFMDALIDELKECVPSAPPAEFDSFINALLNNFKNVELSAFLSTKYFASTYSGSFEITQMTASYVLQNLRSFPHAWELFNAQLIEYERSIYELVCLVQATTRN